MTQLKDGGCQPSNREERSLSASTVIARWQGNGWDEPCKSRGLRTVLWAAGGEIPPADPAIRLRGDSHYACPEVMSWCEANGLEYIFGLAGNATLAARVRTLEVRMGARYAARPRRPGSNCAAIRTSRVGPSPGNASAGSGRSRTRRGRHPLHRHQLGR